MDKAAEKPKRKIDRSKKKRKSRMRGTFQSALGQKDLRTRSRAAASYRRVFGKPVNLSEGDDDSDKEISQLPENATYTMPTSSEESSEDEFFDEETIKSEDEIVLDSESVLDSIEHESEYFGEKKSKNKTDETATSKTAEKPEKDDDNLDNLDNLLNLCEPSDTSLIKSLKFAPTVSKSKWKNADKKISELEMYLDSVLDL